MVISLVLFLFLCFVLTFGWCSHTTAMAHPSAAYAQYSSGYQPGGMVFYQPLVQNLQPQFYVASQPLFVPQQQQFFYQPNFFDPFNPSPVAQPAQSQWVELGEVVQQKPTSGPLPAPKPKADDLKRCSNCGNYYNESKASQCAYHPGKYRSVRDSSRFLRCRATLGDRLHYASLQSTSWELTTSGIHLITSVTLTGDIFRTQFCKLLFFFALLLCTDCFTRRLTRLSRMDLASMFGVAAKKRTRTPLGAALDSTLRFVSVPHFSLDYDVMLQFIDFTTFATSYFEL
jgi:hypothetical protein